MQEMNSSEQILACNKRSWNTISTYFRALRAVYNRAVDEEIIKGEFRLFHNVFTGVTSEKKLALEAGEMRELIDMEIRTTDKNKLNDISGDYSGHVIC